MSGDSRTLYVGNISERVTEEILYELFLQAGPLERVTIPKDKEGRQRKFGFITFKHEASVAYTLELFEGVSLYGRQLNIKFRNGGQDVGSPSLSPGMSPPVLQPNTQSYQMNQPSYPMNQDRQSPGQFHRSHTWHGNLSGEGISGERPHRQQGGSPSPESFRQGHPPRSRQMWQQPNDRQGQQTVDRYNQQPADRYSSQQNSGWFNQGGKMLPPNDMQNQSNDMRRQRVLRQHRATIDAHRPQHGQRYQNYRSTPWQEQSQRYGRY